MKIHIGERIKQRANELRIGPTELGRMINTSKQNVYGIFKRESIDTALLEKVGKALKFDFFSLYLNPKFAPTKDGAKPAKGSKAYPVQDDVDFNQLKYQLSDLKEKYELLKKVNSLLEGKRK